jgi:hypothetical protein
MCPALSDRKLGKIMSLSYSRSIGSPSPDHDRKACRTPIPDQRSQSLVNSACFDKAARIDDPRRQHHRLLDSAAGHYPFPSLGILQVTSPLSAGSLALFATDHKAL